MADPNDPTVTTTKGDAPEGTLPGNAPEPIDPETGQHGAYWVLTRAERAKGFVRPLRYSYRHVGVKVEHPTRPLTDEEQERHGQGHYVAFEQYPESESPKIGRFIEKACESSTRMGQAIAETYAREPTFYGSTFCASCREHKPVDEFVWEGTDERVGS